MKAFFSTRFFRFTWQWVALAGLATIGGFWEPTPAGAIDVLPTPRQVQAQAGRLPMAGCAIMAGPEAGFAAEVLARRLSAPVRPEAASTACPIRLRVDADAPFAKGLSRDARPEAYRLEVGPQGVELLATEPEGLLRASATLLQLFSVDRGIVYAPRVTIVDWPTFRHRCAADWLMNAEVNRWAYDWGDGQAACLARIRRKLDQCFAYKINQVWFDGFGWSLDRAPGYARMMRECNQYARRRGIRLTFGGYGGGYGTSYQPSEIYRCGYFGQTLFNRRPYPDGEEYFCRGMHRIEHSRRYGTCLSNAGLCQAKLDEMRRFVAAVEPGFLYIHDIDTGTYVESQASWRLRCDECRRRWPSDELADPQGQAGALADWYRQIRRSLDGISAASGYRAARDLTLIFTSPLYACYYEKGPVGLWQRETDYFCVLSRLLGPAVNAQFGLREQFYGFGGTKKIAALRAALDKSGGATGVHVIAFGGGDNYLSDDLVNLSGLMAPFYEGAHSVCLSNGGVHEEPVQILNAELLWAGTPAGCGELPPDEAAVQALFRQMCQGKHRPPEILGPEKIFHRICRRLWGDAAGTEMYLAYLIPGSPGAGPLSRVWWAVTADVARLRAKSLPAGFDWRARRAHWQSRKLATDAALAHARRAAALRPDEDLQWFATCLALGSRFCRCMSLAIELREKGDIRLYQNDSDLRVRLAATLSDLETQIVACGRNQKTDALGGDPGCWLETVAHLKQLIGR